MMIDWFTVIAQALNFLILVWLLKRFLYQPILNAIDAREQRIAKAIAEADAKKKEALEEREEFERKNQKLAEVHDALVSQMREEVNAKRQRLLDDAQLAADALGAKRLETMQREQKALGDEIARRAQDHVFSISRSALRDLADVSLEDRITDVFIRRLRELKSVDKQEVDAMFSASSEPLQVRTAFKLSEEQQAAIRQVLSDSFSADRSVRFEIAPKSIGGIEVISNGRKIAWNIDSYLDLLQKSIAEVSEVARKTKRPAAELVSESPV